MDHHELENGTSLSLDFKKLAKVVACGEDLIPAVAQDAESGEVLIVGYANQLSPEYSPRRRAWLPFGVPAGMNYGSKERPRVII